MGLQLRFKKLISVVAPMSGATFSAGAAKEVFTSGSWESNRRRLEERRALPVITDSYNLSQVGRSPAINGIGIKHQKSKIDFKMRWKPMATAQGWWVHVPTCLLSIRKATVGTEDILFCCRLVITVQCQPLFYVIKKIQLFRTCVFFLHWVSWSNISAYVISIKMKKQLMLFYTRAVEPPCLWVLWFRCTRRCLWFYPKLRLLSEVGLMPNTHRTSPDHWLSKHSRVLHIWIFYPKRPHQDGTLDFWNVFDLKTWMCYIAVWCHLRIDANFFFQLNPGKTKILFFDPDFVQKEKELLPNAVLAIYFVFYIISYL